MPRIDAYRPALESEASRLLNTRVSVARIDSEWHGFHPGLHLVDVKIFDHAGNVALALPELNATLSWLSVPALHVRFRELWILRPELDVQRRADGRFEVAGFVVDPKAADGDGQLSEWVLSQPHIGIRNARVRYLDASAAAEAIEFEDVQFEFRRGLVNNHFAFRARPPAALAATIDVRGEYRRPHFFGRANDITHWTGRLFAQTDFADAGRIAQLSHALPETMSIERAQGALRAWLDFDQGRIEHLVADLALVGVTARLGERLEPLEVDRLQGRIEQRRWGADGEGGQEFSAHQLLLTGTDLALAPTDARIRITHATGDRPERGLLEASGLSLTTVSALSRHLPLPSNWHATAARLGVRGNLANLRYTWEGPTDAPAQYSLRTQFDGLALLGEAADPPLLPSGRPRPGRPGFENLSGTLDIDQRGGSAQVRARDALLEFPGVFEQRLAFATLNANARWATGNGFELAIESLAASGPEIEISGQASYRSGGKGFGFIDASGQMLRAEANQVHKYVPLAVPAATRSWLRTALVGGVARDGSFKIKGDLLDFPFADPKSGEFKFTARIVGGTLDYLPERTDESGNVAAAWPQITDIDGDFLFERNRIEVTARRAQIFGTQLANVRANLPELGKGDVKLTVDGKGAGPLTDMIRFVNASPVGG
jgi:uncharacterized protein YhdP